MNQMDESVTNLMDYFYFFSDFDKAFIVFNKEEGKSPRPGLKELKNQNLSKMKKPL